MGYYYGSLFPCLMQFHIFSLLKFGEEYEGHTCALMCLGEMFLKCAEVILRMLLLDTLPLSALQAVKEPA